ncbi:MAG TPA: hypothetical protein VEY06_06260 [Flavisolibacter sp.]|nr:hypothetical protein [Flavisolibacter sp.]
MDSPLVVVYRNLNPAGEVPGMQFKKPEDTEFNKMPNVVALAGTRQQAEV